MHRGHGFELSDGGAGFAYSLLTMRTMKNTHSAMMRNVTIELTNEP